jgi:hypothetical protein
MRQTLYEGDNHDVAKSLNNVGITYKALGDIGKYNLYIKQAASSKGFIKKRGITTQGIIEVKQRFQKILNKMQELSAKGDWSDRVMGSDWGVLGYLDEGYFKKQLGNLNNAQNVKIALSLCFEAINIGITNSVGQNLNCAVEFVKVYPGLVIELVIDHPEYFALESIARACLGEAEYRMIVAPAVLNEAQGSKEEFKGQGTLVYPVKSYYEYYNTALDKLLKLRLWILDPEIKKLDSWYLSGDRLSAVGLAYKVANEFSKGIELILAPANLQGKHWLGLAFRKSYDVVTVVYMDSEQRAIAQWLKVELGYVFSMNGYFSQFLEPRLERQRYSNCGPEAIENFVYYMTGSRATQEGAVYVHSLLVENSLLDPKVYGLKIEENSKLIGFLSNAQAIRIVEVPLLTEQWNYVGKGLVTRVESEGERLSPFVGGFRFGVESFFKRILYRKKLEKFAEVLDDYSIELPAGLTALDVLLDNSKFNKFVMSRIHPDKNPFGAGVAHEDTLFVRELRGKFTADLDMEKLLGDAIAKANSMLHRASIGFKALDVAVDSARLAQEPTMVQAKKLTLGYAYLHGMIAGVNKYSAAISGAEVIYQMHLSEYQKAFEVATTTLSAMFLPALLAMANRPYLGFVYGVWIATSTVYNTALNAYSLTLDLSHDDARLKSTTAYKNLAEQLAASPLQALHDFGAQATEYKLQINDMLFEKEKAIIKAHLPGEFGQKVFDYVHLPALTESYGLMKNMIRGTLTEEEAKTLLLKQVTITHGSLHYNLCLEARSLQDDNVEHYYCYNLEEQLLDHVTITGGNNLEVVEKL